jgi:hypothetical protein
MTPIFSYETLQGSVCCEVYISKVGSRHGLKVLAYSIDFETCTNWFFNLGMPFPSFLQQ